MGDAKTSSNDFSFGRNSRLLNADEFQQVFAAARRSADRYFTVLYRDNGTDRPRIGFTIAKKKIPTAVGRNRVRRLARESFRLQNQTLGGVDIIILAQRTADRATNAQLFASFDMHWQRLQQRKDQPRRPKDSA